MADRTAKRLLALALLPMFLFGGCVKTAPQEPAPPAPSGETEPALSETTPPAPSGETEPVPLETALSVSPGAAEPVTAPLSHFEAEVWYEWHDDIPEEYKVDIVLPLVVPAVAGSAELNARIDAAFGWVYSGNEIFWRSDAYPYTWVEFSYSVSNQGGICSLDVIQRFSSLLAPEAGESFYVTSFYYDENTSAVIPTAEEYLAKLGYDRDDLLAMLREQYGNRYDGIEIDLSDLLDNFRFDEAGKAVFVTRRLEDKLNP